MKLLRVVARVLRQKKTWRWPRRADVLIFDCGRNPAYDQCLEQLLQPYPVECLPLMDRDLNIPVLLASLFRRGGRKISYYDQYIERVGPRLLLTYVDNNPDFYSFAIRNPRIKTMFIQNGTRGVEVFELLDKQMFGANLRVDYMMTFGSGVSAEYSKYIQGTVIPMGSFRNNLVPVIQQKIKGTLAFVSQYRDVPGFDMGGEFYTFQRFWEQTDRLILPFLAEYAEKRNISFCIIPCSGHYKDRVIMEKEKRYYQDIIGHDCTFSEWRWHGSSYDVIDSTEVIVAIDSSMGLEAAARGTKAAIYSIRSTLLSLPDSRSRNYGWPGAYPDDGPFWTNRPDTAAFKRILDHLFEISDEQWRAELEQQRFSDVMTYDPGCGLLRSVLQKELGPGRSH